MCVCVIQKMWLARICRGTVAPRSVNGQPLRLVVSQLIVARRATSPTVPKGVQHMAAYVGKATTASWAKDAKSTCGKA